MNIFIAMPDNEVTRTFITVRSLEALKNQGNVTQNPTGRELNEDELSVYAKDADVIVSSIPC